MPEPGLLTDMPALGGRWRARIGNVDVEVVLPVIASRDDESSMVALGPPFPLPSTDMRWGAGDEDEGAVYVSALAFSVSHGSRAQEVADALAANVEPWVTLLLEWLGVWSRQPVHPMLPFEHLRVEGSRSEMWDFGADEAQAERVVGRGSIWITASAGTALSAAQWERGLELASAGERPSLAYLLLHQADQELLRGDLRRSIVEGGTAAEVAVSQAVAAELEPMIGKERSESILNVVRGARNRFDLARQLGLPLPTANRVQKKLLTARNRAAHEAAEPERDVVREALVVAREVVEALVSLQR